MTILDWKETILGIDIGVKDLTFGLYHAVGAGLVIVGFLMLLVPNTLVNPGNSCSADQAPSRSTARGTRSRTKLADGSSLT